MKHLLFFPFMLALFLMPSRSEASHLMGVDINYTCVNACTIHVEVRAYRSCEPGASTSIPASAFSWQLLSGACALPTLIGSWSSVVITEVTPLCPGASTPCSGGVGPPNGVQQYYYEADYDICAGGTGCIFSAVWNLCCRNDAITSLTSPSGDGIYSSSTTLNTTLAVCNSSPEFTNPPVPYVCNNQPYTFNQGAVDPEGDSLSYSIGPCFASNGTIVSYDVGNGYTELSPLGPSWDVQIDPITGDITLTPQPGNIEIAVMCVYVTEWRNGVAINTIVRDMQITVIPCTNVVPLTTGGTNVQNGTQVLGDPFSFVTCAGNNFCFDIPMIDPDAAQVHGQEWDQNLAALGATFTNANNGAQVDSISGAQPTGRFCWTPPSSGTYFFLLTVFDNNCPVIGQNQYTFTIIVGGLDVIVTDSVLGCGPVALCVTPTEGIDPFTFTWTGPGGLTANPDASDSCLIHVYPGTGTYTYSITVTDSTNSCPGTFNGSITIPDLIMTAGGDQTICSGDTATIGEPDQVNVVYQWSPIAGLTSPNSGTTDVILLNGGATPTQFTYTLSAVDTTSGCTGQDQVVVTVNPIPSSQFTLPSQICAGAPVLVSYAGWNNNTATFNWDFGVGATPATATGIGPHSVSWASSGTKGVTLSVTLDGCTSPLSVDSITVFPIPVATIGPVTDQCVQTNNFDFFSTGTYGPTATFQWNFYQGATPNTSTLENPTGIVWSSAGGKQATLQITENGCVSNLATINFNIFEEPNALWTNISGVQCFDGNVYNFAASGGNGAGATYDWSFTNGTPGSSTVINPSGISFSQPGLNSVSLIVSENGCLDTVTTDVFVAPSPIVDAGPDASFCEGSGGAQLFGTGQGGTPIPPSNTAYYWTWWCDSTNTWCGLDSVFNDDPVANPFVSTMYYTQITDFNGCVSNIDSAFVTVIPKPLVNAGPDVYICADSAPCIILNPSITNSPGPFSYQWVTSVGLNDPTLPNPCARPDTTTIYTLFVTDIGTGCNSGLTTVDSNSSITVHVHPLPVAWAGPDKEVCLGDSVMLEGFGTNAGPAYGFQWSPATGLSDFTDANPMASPSATTEYVLTVWSNSCPSIGDTVRVTTHTLPTADAGPDVEICLGEVGMLDAQAYGDPFSNTYTFEWSPPTGVIGSTSVEDLLASPTSTTTYSVIATSEFGCESAPDEALLTVKPMPFPEAGEPITICSGDTVDLTGSYYYTTTDTVDDPTQILYTWYPGTNISSTTTPLTSVWPTGSSFYYLQLNYNTCSSLDSVLINVTPTPLAWVQADTTVICSKDSVLLTGGGGVGGATFTWSPTAGLSAGEGDSLWASPSVTTTYVFTATEGQCRGTDTLTLEVIPSPEVAYMSSLTEGCAPFDVSFLSLSSDVILTSWDFGDGSPTSNDINPLHTYVNPGTYVVSLIGTNTGGCDDKVNSLTINVFEPARADFTSDPDYPIMMSLPNTLVNFFDRSSSNAVSWMWNFGDGVTAEGTKPSHNYMDVGEYMVTLTVTNEQGCVAEVTHGPYIVLSPEIFIPNVFSPNDDNINDEFWVRYTGNQPYQLDIYDRWGNLLFSQRDKYTGWDGKFNNAPAPEGVYYYTVTIGDKQYTGNVTMVR